jgi:4-hydroxybenzoate polyprenyltransferase
LVEMKPQIHNLLSKFTKFFFSNSIFLALNGALVFVFASLLYDTEISLPLLLGAFLITLSVYSLNMATDSEEDNINRSQTAPKTARHYLALSLTSMAGSIIIGILNGVYALLVLVSPLLIGAVYSVKIAKSIPRLKEVVGVKSLVVALSWGITGAFLPATMYPIPIYKELLVFFYVFTQILVNTIIFDTLDVNGDHASGIKTIPLALGLKKTKSLLLMINASFILWLGYCLYSGVFIHYLVTLAFGVGFETLLIWYFFQSSRPRLHAELLVDGEWVYLVLLMRLFIR